MQDHHSDPMIANYKDIRIYLTFIDGSKLAGSLASFSQKPISHILSIRKGYLQTFYFMIKNLFFCCVTASQVVVGSGGGGGGGSGHDDGDD